MPLYEYACPICGAVFSRLRPRAAAAEGAPCPDCGGAAVRTLAGFAVHRRAEAPAEPPPRSAATGPPLCRRYPHVPLLCHMEPKAAERWIAKAEGREEQYLEREARRQEAAARAGISPPPEPVGSGDHHHLGHVHTHASAHPGEAKR